MTGSYTNTASQCNAQAEKLIKELISVGTKVSAAVSFTGSILDPYYAMADALVTTSNYQVACQFSTQAAQIKVKLQTESGRGDILWTLLNVPVEGFFQGKYNNKLVNQVWSAAERIVMGSMGIASLTCQDIGFSIGKMW